MNRQSRIGLWVRTTFGEVVATNTKERALRVVEEAVELAQSCEVDAATLHRLVDYVFGRPPGVPEQEIAGCMVTLYAVASTLGVNADDALEAEIARIHRPEIIERCRRRQREKDEAAVTGRCTSCGWPERINECVLDETHNEITNRLPSVRVEIRYADGRQGRLYFAEGWQANKMFREIARQKELFEAEQVWCEP